jgi:putative ABC transport system ATP-binding protein
MTNPTQEQEKEMSVVFSNTIGHLRRNDGAKAGPATPAVASATSDAIIQVNGVTKVYSSGDLRVEALSNVSLEVARGEMLAIMGPSGCGKTTLLNCMSGLDRVTAGNVIIDGTDLASMNDREKTSYRAHNMGFIFQTYNLLPVLSAVENVELPLVVSGVSTSKARRQALEALDRVGLADRANNWPAQLSGGQRQRVTIARALVNQPAIVWADEPTGALDSKTANEIMEIMTTLNRGQGQTFVIVTHDPGVGKRCDRVISMSDGQIVGEERN